MSFRQRFRGPPTKRDKHEITWSNLSQNASTTQNVNLVQGVQVGDKNSSSECAIGSHVRAIYFEFHFSAETISSTKVIHWKVEVLTPPSTQTMSIANSYYQNDRSFIIKRGMEMLPKDVGTVYKRIVLVLIPRVYQRIKEQMFIRFRYQASSTETINACGIAIYKEIY